MSKNKEDFEDKKEFQIEFLQDFTYWAPGFLGRPEPVRYKKYFLLTADKKFLDELDNKKINYRVLK